ncbi:lactonase family protein [Granulosicoccus sp.]|nr:lactonase family protein [Granulosicoccus sp.]MDB4223208.1 lactonase family protein [Granulosicoccus sp.]
MTTAKIALDQEYPLLVGTYTDLDALAHQPHAPSSGKGIYGMTLTKDGELVEREVVEALNPAVLIPHSNGKMMYAIVETIQNTGDVLQYSVGEDSSLSLVKSFSASGKSTCYLALSPQKDVAIVINYWDAIVDVVHVDEAGQLGEVLQSFKQHYREEGTWRQVTHREDHWTNRQVGPHAHCAHFWKDWVFIPDLGENAIFQYRYDPTQKVLEPDTHIEFEAGSGPRHMVMHPNMDICYVSNELFNTVCVATLDSSDPEQEKRRLVPIQYVSTLENREQVSYVSEIKLSPDARFLYVSNRGDNSLAIFKVLDDGQLERIGLVPTGGKFPRHFSITPCGKAVLIANQDTSTINLFHRDIESGLVSATGYEYEIPSPNYVRFI